MVAWFGQNGRIMRVKKAGPTDFQGGTSFQRKGLGQARRQTGLPMRAVAATIRAKAGWPGIAPMKLLAIRPGRCRSLSQAAKSGVSSQPVVERAQAEGIGVGVDAAMLVKDFIAHEIGDAFEMAGGAERSPSDGGSSREGCRVHGCPIR